MISKYGYGTTESLKKKTDLPDSVMLSVAMIGVRIEMMIKD